MTEDDKQWVTKISWVKMTLWTKQPLLWLIGGICHIQRCFYSWIICIAISWQFEYWHCLGITNYTFFKCTSHSLALDHLCSGPKRGNDYCRWWNKEAETAGCQRQSVDSRYDSSSGWQSCQFGGLGIKGKICEWQFHFQRERERKGTGRKMMYERFGILISLLSLFNSCSFSEIRTVYSKVVFCGFFSLLAEWTGEFSFKHNSALPSCDECMQLQFNSCVSM